jgi:hypothetical protein
MTEIKKVHFIVTGEFVTQHARSIVSEERWEDALHFLMTSLVGMTYDHAVNILAGKAKLIGENNNVQMVEDDCPNPKYIEHLKWVYRGYVRINNEWYSPYAYVSSFGVKDMFYYDETPSTANTEANWRHRSRFYMNDRLNDKVLSCRLKWHDNFEYTVLFKKRKAPPLWMFDDLIRRKPQDVVAEPLEERGHAAWFGKAGLVESGNLRGTPVYKEKVIQDIVEPTWKSEKPTPDPKYSSPFGWVLPNGDFYGCDYMGHMSLCRDIFELTLKEKELTNPEKEAEKRGWLKIGSAMTSAFNKITKEKDWKDSYIGLDKPLTQAQKDTLFGWCKNHDIPYPKEQIEAIDEEEKL